MCIRDRLNLLTDAGVYTQNQLFATLDPTALEIVLPDGQHAVIIDTVGLIQRLPHQLVEAFKSTLEEAAAADVILNVCDAADPMAKQQIEVTKILLGELDVYKRQSGKRSKNTGCLPMTLFPFSPV